MVPNSLLSPNEDRHMTHATIAGCQPPRFDCLIIPYSIIFPPMTYVLVRILVPVHAIDVNDIIYIHHQELSVLAAYWHTCLQSASLDEILCSSSSDACKILITGRSCKPFSLLKVCSRLNSAFCNAWLLSSARTSSFS